MIGRRFTRPSNAASFVIGSILVGAISTQAAPSVPSSPSAAPSDPSKAATTATSATAPIGSSAPSAASTPPLPPSVSATTPAAAPSTCTEQLPEGKERPKIQESFPSKGKSGYTAWLKVEVEHGKGETVLPGGFHLQDKSDEAHGIEAAGFFIPDTSGPSAPKLTTVDHGTNQLTTVSIPFVPLPKKPGRNELDLPSVPIAIARASGDIVTLCTAPHHISLEDPIANDPNPKPKSNPRPLRQVEEWTLLKNATYGALVALAVAAVVAWLIALWRRRPRVAPPPPPPRPPWEVAMEALHDIRHAKLIEQGRYADHFDRVSDAVRRYLGDLYGFDGLESTTREVILKLERTTPVAALLGEIKIFLRKADLVKFARLTPTEAECHDALERGEQIVRKTMPTFSGVPAHAIDQAPSAPQGGVSE